MKNRGEYVWLSGEQRRVLSEFCKKTGRSKSWVLREAFLWFLKGEAGFELEECVLDSDLERLEEESRRLQRAQRLILRDHAYLKDYVEEVMKGGWISRSQVRRRPPLPETPEASLSVRALEGIFARRAEIGRSAAELAVKRWPGKYDVGPVEVKKGFQTGFLRWPECPYWMTSQYNRKFEGPPDRKWCDKKNKEVEAEKCMACWSEGMKKKVELDPEWDSWRKSREYFRLRVYLDEFDFDENMEWLLRSNGRSVATLNKPAKRRDGKRGSDT